MSINSTETIYNNESTSFLLKLINARINTF